MKMHRLGRTLLVLMMICVVSCVSNLEALKKREEATRKLGEAYMDQRDYTAALKEFIKAETIYPDDPYLHNDLGRVYIAKGEMELSIKHLKRSLALKPDAATWNDLGIAYLGNKEWDTAIAIFKEVAKNLLYSTPQYPLSNVGLAYYSKGDYVLAEKYYKEALKLDPTLINAVIGLGRTYLAVGKVSEAVAMMEASIKDYPSFAQLYYYLAEAYGLSKNYKKSFDTYQKAIEFSTDADLTQKAKIASQKIKHLQ